MRRLRRSGGGHLRQSHRGQACCEVQAPAGRVLAAVAKPIRTRAWGIALRCTIGTSLANTQSRLHPAPGGVWRVGKLRSAAGNILPQPRRQDKELETEGVFMNTRTKLAIAAGAAIWMVPILKAFAGIDIAAGDWKVDFAGNVNAFYVGASCDTGTNNTVIGGLACTGDHSAAVRNGLLPAALVFSATTQQSDFDIDVTVGFYPGINSSAAAGVNGAGQPSALATPGIDARQVYFTFGDASWGTVKLGRDIGIFGKDAILDDMTLLGVGTAGPTNVAPSNTSLGRIGIGYIYTDWQPQITYTSPSFNGFSVSAGIFQPLDAVGSASYVSHNAPQVQVGGSYAWGDPKAADTLSGKVWVDVVSQQAKASKTDIAANGAGAETKFTGTAVDGGVKLDIAGFEGVLYGYTGKGVGTTGLYILPTS